MCIWIRIMLLCIPKIAAGALTPGLYFLEIAREGKRVAVKQFVVN